MVAVTRSHPMAEGMVHVGNFLKEPGWSPGVVRSQNAAQGLFLGWRVLPGGGGCPVLLSQLQPHPTPAPGWQFCLSPSSPCSRPTQSFQVGFWSQGMAAEPHDPKPPPPGAKEGCSGQAKPFHGALGMKAPHNHPHWLCTGMAAPAEIPLSNADLVYGQDV